MNAVQNSYPDLYYKLLEKRGLKTEQEIDAFLYPKLANLPPPGGMKNLHEAADLVERYMDSGNQIIVWGDYDVDGTTGTALLVNFFNTFNIEVLWYIPNRLTEGYGLNVAWFYENKNRFKSKNFLLITVDCGISNQSEIKDIQGLGGAVIVTDHHAVPEVAPDCIVLNPEQVGCGFSNEKLAGVGVAFYLAAGIKSNLLDNSSYNLLARKVLMKNFLAFVALGTLADLVELTATNRTLVKGGLEALGLTPFKGLKNFVDANEVDRAHLNSDDVGYLLGPKINAAGRLGKSFTVVELFTEKDEQLINKKIALLDSLNKRRKEICGEDTEKAVRQINAHMISRKKYCFISGGYHPGVAGIVASRLVELYRVPALVLCEEKFASGETVFKGSGRSIDGINLVKALNACSSLLIRYGGHAMAAGLALSGENLKLFEVAFSAKISEMFESLVHKRRAVFDLQTDVDTVMDPKMLKALELLEPYGPLNPQPIFRAKNTRLIQCKTIGQNGVHLSGSVRGKYSNYRAIGFGLGDRISDIQISPDRDLIFTPTKNRYRGNTSWQVRILDIT